MAVEIGCKCEQERKRIKDLVRKAIIRGALSNEEAFVEVDGLNVILSDMEDGKTCYLCPDKREGLRFRAVIINPRTETSEAYSLHCYHFVEING